MKDNKFIKLLNSHKSKLPEFFNKSVSLKKSKNIVSVGISFKLDLSLLKKIKDKYFVVNEYFAQIGSNLINKIFEHYKQIIVNNKNVIYLDLTETANKEHSYLIFKKIDNISNISPNFDNILIGGCISSLINDKYLSKLEYSNVEARDAKKISSIRKTGIYWGYHGSSFVTNYNRGLHEYILFFDDINIQISMDEITLESSIIYLTNLIEFERATILCVLYDKESDEYPTFRAVSRNNKIKGILG